MAKGRIRLLMVDDDFLEEAALGLRCANLNYDILPYTDGKSVFRDLARKDLSYDVAIIDKSLPDFDGDVIISKLKEEFPDRPVISLTGYIGSYTRQKGSFRQVRNDNLRADLELQKPMHPEIINEYILKLLGLD
jgi:DNA-binding response OmpR family regulator